MWNDVITYELYILVWFWYHFAENGNVKGRHLLNLFSYSYSSITLPKPSFSLFFYSSSFLYSCFLPSFCLLFLFPLPTFPSSSLFYSYFPCLLIHHVTPPSSSPPCTAAFSLFFSYSFSPTSYSPFFSIILLLLPFLHLPPSPRLLYNLWFILRFLPPHASVDAESEKDSLLLKRFPLLSTFVAFTIWSGERKLRRVTIPQTSTSPLLRPGISFNPHGFKFWTVLRHGATC